ncbi:MAG: TIGR03560 family F420-dependent LLM class oxidoreductase [Pseudonocardiaceae bacterium]
MSILLTPSYAWADVLRVAKHTERSGWEGVWFSDHFMPAEGELSQPVLECWATLAGLAAVVPRVRLGALVCGNTYRHPAVLANIAVAADHVSGGRVVLGIGAGWQENEHAAYGIHFGSTGQRLDRLEEACQVIRGLRDRDRVTFHGQHYQVEGASMHPKPVGRLPLLVGGGGERRTIPIAARYADEWNAWATVETFVHKAGVLERACEEAGRDPRELRRSTQVLLALRVPGSPRRPVPSRLPIPAVEGGVEQLRDTLGRYAAAGVDEFIVPGFRPQSPDETIALIDVLTSEVLPVLPSCQK